MKYLLIIIYLICTTGGITFMKLGGDSIVLSLKDGLNFKIGISTLFGFLLYLCSFLLWQRIIVKYDLSFIVPIVTGIVQIIVLLIGFLFFKESISSVGMLGVVLIILGIILMAIGKI